MSSDINSPTTKESSQPTSPEYEQPIKKRRILINDEILQLPQISVEKLQQQVSKSVIERQWSQLNPDSLGTLENILEIGIVQTIDNEKHANSINEFLNNLWLNQENSQSFKSRIQITKLPHPRSMFTKNADNTTNRVKDPLNSDELMYKKKVLENYLNAETNQMTELEYNYNELDSVYKQDLKYLRNYRKAIKANEKELNIEIQRKLDELNIKEDEEGLDLRKSEVSTFNPDEDEDTREVLEKLHIKLNDISSNVSSLAELNNKLKILCNMLD